MTVPFTEFVAKGPIEVVFGRGVLQVNTIDGPLLYVSNARAVILHYLDHGETEIFGDTSQPPQN